MGYELIRDHSTKKKKRKKREISKMKQTRAASKASLCTNENTA